MKFKWRNLLISASLYASAVWYLAQISDIYAIGLVLYSLACMLIAKAFIRSAETRLEFSTHEFNRTNAASLLGVQYGSFHHVFSSSELVVEEYARSLRDALSTQLGCNDFKEKFFKDVDSDLPKPETRSFFLGTLSNTARGSQVSILCDLTRTHQTQGVRWWTMVRGQIDINKVFNRYSFAPLSVPLRVVPFFKRQHDPLEGLRTIHPGFFNDIDVSDVTRQTQFIAFETLVRVLDSFGIDTTDLKQQRANVLSINVSGGQTNFGSVVQGAMNKVTGNAAGGRS